MAAHTAATNQAKEDPLNLLRLPKWSPSQVISYVQAVLGGEYPLPFEDHLEIIAEKGHPDLAAYLEAFANGYQATCFPLPLFATKLLASYPISGKLIGKLTGMLMAIKGKDHIWQAVLAVRRPTTQTTVKTVVLEEDTDFIENGKHNQVHTNVLVEQTVTSKPCKGVKNRTSGN
ncbi:MAG: hypothetical protein EBU90_16690 [Proteobacteria bacterium]|nr:hypothetical protein [Pseudomonadota bacterium]